MPAGYDQMVEQFVAKGMSQAAAEAKATRLWNWKHPENPVGVGTKKKKAPRKTKRARLDG